MKRNSRTIICYLTALLCVACQETPIQTEEYGLENNESFMKDSSSDNNECISVGQYALVGTNQQQAYDNNFCISLPQPGEDFYGQDVNFPGEYPQYVCHSDGTVFDAITGLMWTRSPDWNYDGVIDYQDKMTFQEALAFSDSLTLGGYHDWRLPSIKELYSLIDFSGEDISGYTGTSVYGLIPFIDQKVFAFAYGDLSAGERLIDAQMLSSTLYTSTTMEGAETVFGVNFADGRIKGYGLTSPKGEKHFYVYFVRGNERYGQNDFEETEPGIITDHATGLMWMKEDSREAMTWQEALSYAENYEYGGYADWHLPNAKELQSIVDYTRSPDATGSAAIDPVFSCSEIVNEAGQKDYPAYWTSTTHQSSGKDRTGISACYLCFGRAMGFMGRWIDVHGAGAQRSDPKTGNPKEYPQGFGPQGDAIRIYNYVRLVRRPSVSTDTGSVTGIQNVVLDN